MPAEPLHPADRDTEIDVVAWGIRLWRHKWLGLVLLIVALVAATVYLRNAEYRYTATLLVTPADQSGSKPTGGIAGLGSLVGVDLTGQTGSAFSLYADAVTSYPVAERLSHDKRVMHAVFRAAWNDRLHRWQEPASFLHSTVDTLKAVLGLPRQPWHVPDADSLKTFLDTNITVTEDKRKLAVTMAFDDADPRFAAYLLDRINAAADSFLRQKALARATIYVDYLERRLSQVQVAEYRQSMAQVLGNYEKTRMMASSDASYAVEPFGEVWVSPVPTRPRAGIVFAVAVLGAIVVWLGYVLLLRPMIAAFRRAPTVVDA